MTMRVVLPAESGRDLLSILFEGEGGGEGRKTESGEGWREREARG